MKKIILLLAVATLFFVNASAQTGQGKIMAGGSMGINFGNSFSEYDGTKGPKTKNFGFSATPKIGYFVIDGLAAGLSLDITSETSKMDEDGMDYKASFTSFSVGPFVRYYSSVGLFGEAALGLGSTKSKREGTGIPYEGKSKIFGWSLGAGYAIFLNDNVSIEPMISYNRATTTDDDDSKDKFKSGQLMIEVGFNIFL